MPKRNIPKKILPHPIQPVGPDQDGIVRFQPNAIVQHLLDNGGIDLNQLAQLEFSQNDREQFAQLIGYSLSGFSELSYVSDTTYGAAEEMRKNRKLTQEQALIQTLKAQLASAREGVRDAAVALFRIHPDDLHT